MRAVCFGAWLCVAVAVAAPEAGAGELAEMARAARSDYRPVTAEDLAAARSSLDAARTRWEQFLTRDPQQAAAWRAYLRLPQVEEELARGAEGDVEAISDTLARLRANHAGLELAPFRELRAAVEEYLRVLRALQGPPTREEFEQRLDALAVLLAEYERQPRGAVHLEISRQLAWLHAKRQASSLVTAAGDRLSAPNAVFYVAAPVIAAATLQEIDRNTAIRDVDDEQYSFGVGRLRGRAAAFPAPSAGGQGLLEIRFTGTLRTRVTTMQDPVRVFTQGWAPVVARKPVALTEQGLFPQPTRSQICYNNTVDCIATTLKRGLADALVKKLAGVYVNAQEDEIERDAARSAEERFNEEFDNDAADDLAKANAALQDKFRKPLLRLGLYPRRFEFRTDHEALRASMLQDGAGRLASPSAPPALAAGTEIGVQLHESFINNYGAALLAGKFFTVEEFETLLAGALGQLKMSGEKSGGAGNEEAEAEAPPGEVGILFDDLEPIQAQFAGDVATLTVRGKRYVFEGRTYPPMNIILRYRLQNDSGKLRATLVDEPEYTPPPGVRGLRVAALRRILQAHITPRIEREIVQGELHFPDSDGEDELGALDFHQVAAAHAWLTIALRRREPGDNAPYSIVSASQTKP